jgi:hypothetical protein
MKKHDPLPVLVNAENWSEESRHSLKYISAPIEYRDIQFTCYRCRTVAVYSAAEQRESFEVKKRYLWQRRILCQQCFLVRLAFEKEIKGFNIRWLTERQLMEKDPELLKRWLELLRDLPFYGARKNIAHIAMIVKLIGNEY